MRRALSYVLRWCRCAAEIVLGAIVASAPIRADVFLAPLFGDHAVLQRDKSVPVWGEADPGEKIVVTFHDQTRNTTTDQAGHWRVTLAALNADAEGADLTVSGKNSRVVHDVVVGEVWLCSGQSNMEFSVKEANNAQVEIAAANFPLLRQIRIAKTAAPLPRATVAVSGWKSATPETAGDFTAVGYFFARELQARLKIPIGLVHSSWGGTSIEVWIAAAVLARDPALAVVNERWQKIVAEFPQKKTIYERELPVWKQAADHARESGPASYSAFVTVHPAPREPQGPETQWAVSNLYNGMIEPLAPYALRGFLWYQGENNVFRSREYHRLFAALIMSWRLRFEQGDIPFYWVNLAGFTSRPGADWAGLREAQTQTLRLPNTGQAVAVDVGDAATIHPRNKQTVGHRLALIAAARNYALGGESIGPTFTRADLEQGKLRLRFDHATGGLVVQGPAVTSVEVAGDDGKFLPAEAKIDGETLVVSSPDVPAPIAARYAWSNLPAANLYNSDGLPAVPFRSDLRDAQIR